MLLIIRYTVTDVHEPETCYRSDTRLLLQGLMPPVYISSLSLLSSLYLKSIYAHGSPLPYRNIYMRKSSE